MDHDLTSPEVATALSEDEGLPSTFRRDGWTPFARRLFLEVLAETGRVSLACEYCGLSKQSAYALRARDPVFATSWDAACEIARAPLADALYEKAIGGVTDTITRDGEVVATRHRFDSRLSIAVLHRLDKRCDRAAELGAQHLALVRRWDEWLALVGKGEEQAAAALLKTVPHGQLGQLPESAVPTTLPNFDPSENCWKDDDAHVDDQLRAPAGFRRLRIPHLRRVQFLHASRHARRNRAARSQCSRHRNGPASRRRRTRRPRRSRARRLVPAAARRA